MATYMLVVLLLQFVIHLDVLGTHDTRLLHVIEVEPAYVFSLVLYDFNSFNLLSSEVLTLRSHNSLFKFVVRLLILSD